MSEFRTTFVAPDGTLLEAFVGAGGLRFAKHPNFAGSLELYRNRVAHTTSTPTALYLASIAPAGADCYAEALMYASSTQQGRSGPALRIHPTESTYYYLRYRSSTWELMRVVGGAQTVIGSTSGAFTSGTTRARVEAEASTLRVFLDSVIVIGPVIDATIQSAGRIGIAWDNTSVGGAFGQHVEELAGGDLGAPPEPEYAATLRAASAPATSRLVAGYRAPVYAAALAAAARPAGARLAAGYTAPLYAASLSATSAAAAAALRASYAHPGYAGVALRAAAAPATAALFAAYAAPSGGVLRAVAKRARARLTAGYAEPPEWGACGTRPRGTWQRCHPGRPNG